MPSKKVLVTGVYGLIAGAIYRRLAQRPDRYDVYALARRRHLSERAPKDTKLELPDDKFHLANLTDLDAVQQAMDGVSVVVQMAAAPVPMPAGTIFCRAM